MQGSPLFLHFNESVSSIHFFNRFVSLLALQRSPLPNHIFLQGRSFMIILQRDSADIRTPHEELNEYHTSITRRSKKNTCGHACS